MSKKGLENTIGAKLVLVIETPTNQIRAFLRHCFLESWFNEPIDERFTPVKTQEEHIGIFYSF